MAKCFTLFAPSTESRLVGVLNSLFRSILGNPQNRLFYFCHRREIAPFIIPVLKTCRSCSALSPVSAHIVMPKSMALREVPVGTQLPRLMRNHRWMYTGLLKVKVEVFAPNNESDLLIDVDPVSLCLHLILTTEHGPIIPPSRLKSVSMSAVKSRCWSECICSSV